MVDKKDWGPYCAIALVVAAIANFAINGDSKREQKSAPSVTPLPIITPLKMVAEKKRDDVTEDMFTLEPDQRQYAPLFMAEARHIGAQNNRCGSIVGGAMEKGHLSDGKPVFFITCRIDGKQLVDLFFTENDVAYNRPLQLPPRPELITRSDARVACDAALRRIQVFPSSVDIDNATVYSTGADDSWKVEYEFSSLNGLGNRLPQGAMCLVRPGRAVEVVAYNR